MSFQFIIILFVEVNHMQNILLSPISVWGGNQALGLKTIRIHEVVDHRLEIIIIRASDIRTDNHPVLTYRLCTNDNTKKTNPYYCFPGHGGDRVFELKYLHLFLFIFN